MRTLMVLVLGLLFHSTLATAQKPVRLLANISPPYADEKLPDKGLALELVNHVFTRAGYSPEFGFDSWSRAMEGVSIGLYDALATAWYTKERSEEFIFSKPYLSSSLILVKLREDPRNYYALEHLEGRRLGVRTDYAYGIDFDAIPGLKLVEENHVIQNLLRLLNRSVDVVIGDQRTMALQMHEYLGKEVHKFQVIDIKLPGRDRHVAATRASDGQEKMIADFNRALAEVRKDGSHAAIIAKWDNRYAMPATK